MQDTVDYDVVLYRGVYALYWREQGQPRRRSLNTTDRATAKRLAAEAVSAIERADAPAYTVGQIWDRYRVTLEGRPSHLTSMYEAKSLIPHFGDLPPIDITEEVARAYQAKRRAAGVKAGTILTELNRLAAALNFAVGKDWITKAPELYRPGTQPPKERYLTKVEAQRFLDALAVPHARLFVELALSTAARRGALLGLTWDRIDMVAGRIDLKDPDMVRPAKGRALLPMSKRARESLEAARETAGARDCPYVIQYGGKPIKSLKRALAKAGVDSGIDGVTAHVFRHTAAVWMAEAGLRMELIAQYLGHRNHKITESVYARFSPEYMQSAVDALDF